MLTLYLLLLHPITCKHCTLAHPTTHPYIHSIHSLVPLPLPCLSSSSTSTSNSDNNSSNSSMPCTCNPMVATDTCLSNADAIDATNRSTNSIAPNSPTTSTITAPTNFLHYRLHFLLAFVANLLFGYYGGLQLYYLSTVWTLINVSSLLFECCSSSRERSICHNAVQTDEPAAEEEEEEGEGEEEEGEVVERLTEAPDVGFVESQRSPNFDAPRSCPAWLMRSWSTEDEGVDTSCEVTNIPSYYECEEAVRVAAGEDSGGGEEAEADDANDAVKCHGGKRRWWRVKRHSKKKEEDEDEEEEEEEVENEALDEAMEEEGLMHRMDESGPLHDKRRTQQRRGGR